MSIRVVCGKCGKWLIAQDALLGKRVRCPGCQTVLAIPAKAPQATAPKAALQPTPKRPAAPPPIPAKKSSVPPPDEFAIAPAHKVAPPPVPLAVRNALAAAAEREQRPAEFVVPEQSTSKRPSIAKVAAQPFEPPGHTYRYFVFLLALMPLCWELLRPQTDPAEEIASPSAEGEPDASPAIADDEEIDIDNMDELIDTLLQSGKLPGAHLARNSWMHWPYAFFAAAMFLGLMLVCLPRGNATAQQLLTIGLITSTGGLIFLMGLQLVGAVAMMIPARGNILFVIIILLLKLIGFAYYAAQLDDGPFLLLFFGFTIGVGLCEELTKAMPVLFRGRDGKELDWRGAGARGFASGVGFGVAEGILYSSRYYNGIAPFNAYLVRFASCVTLHAVWTAAVGIMIWRYREELQDGDDWRYFVVTILKVLAVPMILHGLYDTALTKDMPLLALATACGSFGWLALQIELVLRRERAFYADLNRRHIRAAAT